ncbi:hypothetical protein, partial [uncultured Fibrobacter sp.]|uniref:hypothetical protein n=1 Tax=uncultured Fibrobacter sp. TaxID=261512 RepID=UPI002611DD24
MNFKRLSTAALCAAFAISAISCSSDETITNDNLSIVSSLDPEDCNDKTEGTMNFVKPKATMYVCSEGEWIAMSDQEAIQYRCESRELKDKSGFAIVCDGMGGANAGNVASEQAANAISAKIDDKEIAERRDFRDVTTFTIDPADAKDFDEALSIR